MELEEVKLIENPQTPVVNPKETPIAPAEVEETPAPEVEETEEETPETEEETKENPNVITSTFNKATGWVEHFTAGVSVLQLGVGAVGIIAAVIVPKIVKFSTGWKDLVTNAVVTALGGFLLGKVSKPMAVAFVLGCGGVLILKFVKWAMAGFADVPLLLDGGVPGQQPVLGSEFEFEGFDEGPIYNVADQGIYDIGQEPEIHPTAGSMDDIF
jgi:hypothetical protein